MKLEHISAGGANPGRIHAQHPQQYSHHPVGPLLKEVTLLLCFALGLLLLLGAPGEGIEDLFGP
ncbi:MAG: hypothetical protein JSU70_23060, partial [Phycisphaerales bacterium]